MIKTLLALIITATLSFAAFAQTYENTSQKMLSLTNERITIGGYAQIDYNQPLSNTVHKNGKIDIHRIVLLLAYNFSERTQFITELEFEHVKEVYVEQAWINHRIMNGLNLRGGLMLVPMGLINEYHEPPTYNGVERPNVDKYIIPTTWREIGIGINGNIINYGIDYQFYLLNGFNGYDGTAQFNGKSGLRGGRQKGAESYISSPNLAAKVNWFSIPGLKLGISGYMGDSQSKLYNNIDKTDTEAIAKADSSVIGISMLGLDAIYTLNNLELRGQYILGDLSNAMAYNQFTGSDVGSAIQGWYSEIAYSIDMGKENVYKLKPFVRIEQYDTHHKVDDLTIKNDIYNRTDITTGVSLELSKGAVLKADYQIFKNAASDDNNGQVNFGIGVWF
ncbi:MAG: hypothetical protein PF486_12940 [Prolixibacteraceae bacterium]|nr:hypothetical protein [Prolixibacteraceae bacterium]